MLQTDEFIAYIASVRRYSSRTVCIYRDVLTEFGRYAPEADCPNISLLRSYEVYLMDKKGESARTVNQHLSVLSSYCKFLIRSGVIRSNPVRLVSKPKVSKRLPAFFRDESMKEYFSRTDYFVSEDFVNILCETNDGKSYENMLRRMVVGILYGTGIRRAELIDLNLSSFDESRRILHVHGKGDKDREIPLTDALLQEISLYLIASRSVVGVQTASEPLLRTLKGGRLYPVWVDRAVKQELGSVEGITGQKSPHILRHTLASDLLNNGTDLNTIKELLGHSSLAATQVYTHSTIERLQKVYNNAHPRAKNGGNYGD